MLGTVNPAMWIATVGRRKTQQGIDQTRRRGNGERNEDRDEGKRVRAKGRAGAVKQSELAGQRWQESCDMWSAGLSCGGFPEAETFGHAVVHVFYTRS